jgi:hypothetical protein
MLLLLMYAKHHLRISQRLWAVVVAAASAAVAVVITSAARVATAVVATNRSNLLKDIAWLWSRYFFYTQE